MSKWSVSVPLHATGLIKVEAETKEEAIQKALEEGYWTLCHQCSRRVQIDSVNDDVEPDAEEVTDEIR
jgi:hypothetical protein